MLNLSVIISVCFACCLASTCDGNPEEKRGWGDSARCWWSPGCQPECGGFKPNLCGFKNSLQSQLYGQHIAAKTVLQAVSSHWSDDDPSKALVMSFHGPSGVGKSHLSNLIVKNMYGAGVNSPFARKFHSEYVFKDPNKASDYRDELQLWIKTNVSKCARSIFIFDELGFMPEGIIDGLKPFLEPQPMFNGVDYRKSIFIFISNVGGKEITKHCYSITNKGKSRDSITLSELQTVLQSSAYEQENGLRNSGIVKKNLIDHYVPFLPLAEEHVRECILNEIERIRPTEKYRENLFDKVLNELQWHSGVYNEITINRYAPAEISEKPSKLMYSASGCTNVASKVALHFR